MQKIAICQLCEDAAVYATYYLSFAQFMLALLEGSNSAYSKGDKCLISCL